MIRKMQGIEFFPIQISKQKLNHQLGQTVKSNSKSKLWLDVLINEGWFYQYQKKESEDSKYHISTEYELRKFLM